MGPAASQVAIKQTGTNGGGYMGVNSAHPLENPNAFTNLIEMISILLIPAALCFTFGSAVKNKKQGIAIFMAMFLCLVVALGCIAVTEQAGTSQLAQNGAVNMSMAEQAGGIWRVRRLASALQRPLPGQPSPQQLLTAL